MSSCTFEMQEKSDFEIEMIDGVIRVFSGPGREQEAFPLPGNSFDFFSDMHWCGTARSASSSPPAAFLTIVNPCAFTGHAYGHVNTVDGPLYACHEP